MMTDCLEECIDLLVTLTIMLKLLLTLTPTLSADILPVQMYSPLCEVLRGEKASVPLVTVPLVVRFSVFIVAPLGVVQVMEISVDLTPFSVSTEHLREKVSPAVGLPLGSIFIRGGLKSRESG